MLIKDILAEARFSYKKFPHELIDPLLDSGYKFLGKGVFQVALLAPDGTVLKIHTHDLQAQRAFLRYVEYCMKQVDLGNPFVPQIFGYEEKIVNRKIYLLVKTERLFPIKDLQFAQSLAWIANFNFGVRTYRDFINMINLYNEKNHPYSDELSKLVLHLGKDSIKLLVKTFEEIKRIVEKNPDIRYDLHSGNFMYSSDGDIVINDPFA